MNLKFEISKRLSREHQVVMNLLTRLEKCLTSSPVAVQPDWREPQARRIMTELKGALAAEIPNHFLIEEVELFPLYEQDGGGDMVDLLLADHKVILELAGELQPLVEKLLASSEPLELKDWVTLRAKGSVFATELWAHAEKEEFGFVPALDELLDPPTAARIQARYLLM